MKASQTIATIFGNENVLVLAVHPGDETTRFGGLIARACAAGRPPFVAVLTDGSAQPGERAAHDVAMRRERETRAATAQLGLDPDRLLFIGLFDGSVPTQGEFSQAVVAAIDLVMWRNDCHVLCAAADGDPDTRAAAGLAGEVARRTGLALVLRVDEATPGSQCLDTARILPALGRARREHGLPIIEEPTRPEAYVPVAPSY